MPYTNEVTQLLYLRQNLNQRDIKGITILIVQIIHTM